MVHEHGTLSYEALKPGEPISNRPGGPVLQQKTAHSVTKALNLLIRLRSTLKHTLTM